jgi:hypothetical protein
MKLRRAEVTDLKADVHSALPSRCSRRKDDPLVGIWDSEVLPMLKAVPRLRPIVVLREICDRHPEIKLGVRRTVERRVRRWQALNDPTRKGNISAGRRLLTGKRFVLDAFNVVRLAHQGKLQISDLPAHAQAHESICDIVSSCKSGTLARRNKALLALAIVCGLPLRDLADYPIASPASLHRWKKRFVESGYPALMESIPRKNQRFKDQQLTAAIFKILHEPPELHGFHRTNWRQVDLYAALKNIGISVSIWTIRRAIRASGYKWRKAKKVLTSNDPEYRIKVDNIKLILSELTEDESFRPI